VTVGNAWIVIDSVSVKSTLQPLPALVAVTLIVTGLPGKLNTLLVNVIVPPFPPTTLLIGVAPLNNW
jgi:hypothetical protein